MGQKVSPKGLRIGINRDWESRWIGATKSETALWLKDDDSVRKYFLKHYRKAFIDRVELERSKTHYYIFVYASQPLLVTGNDSANMQPLALAINKIVGRKIKVNITVIPVERPELSATIIAREIADAIENRVSFRNAQKMAIKKVMRSGAKGIRTNVSGRLGGADLAREEGYSEGNTPLTTLRADIDYALAEAATPQGQIGCKVWINRGEIFRKKTAKQQG